MALPFHIQKGGLILILLCISHIYIYIRRILQGRPHTERILQDVASEIVAVLRMLCTMVNGLYRLLSLHEHFGYVHAMSQNLRRF